MILQQQLQLHFGSDYDNVAQQATRFVRATLNKKWLRQNRNVILNNEGGIPGMRTSALVSIIEREDIVSGLKAYANYLRQEYAYDKTILSIDLGVNDAQLSRLVEPRLDESRESETIPLWGSEFHSLYDLLHAVRLSPEELEFFRTYSSVKDVRETAALCSLSVDDGYRIWRRVKGRAGRIL